MTKESAGILMYRKSGVGIEVLLVHPGGPFWKNKDDGVWSIPKGEPHESEEKLDAAKREFEEELGNPAPIGDYISLGEIRRKDGKVIYVWAIEGDLDINKIKSNSIQILWPPKTGKFLEIPEIDKAEFFNIDAARKKIHRESEIFLDRLLEIRK